MTDVEKQEKPRRRWKKKEKPKEKPVYFPEGHLDDFVAIDFETMTPEYTSACAVGLVKVKEGIVQQRFYSLINPIPDDRDQTNSHIHGITREMVASAPSFAQLFPQMAEFVGLVADALDDKKMRQNSTYYRTHPK